MNFQKDIFTRISDPVEKNRIFQDLCTSHHEILTKSTDPASELFTLRAEVYNGTELCCRIIQKTSALAAQGDLILQFMMGSEKYLLSTRYDIRDSKCFVQTETDLFHLQRREDYRLRLPTSFKGYFSMAKHQGKNSTGQFQLIDLSGGGCRFLIKPMPPTLSLGDEIEGHLVLPDREKIAIKGQIRHERDDEVSRSQTAGIQFIGLRDQDKNKMIALVMDLYRELFSRLSKT